MRGQKRGTCKTCDGTIHFYPKLQTGEPVMSAPGEVEGAWAHLNPADWRTNPHQPEPQEEG